MITNIVILSISLVTNSQQTIVGQSNGKALVASQETVVQRTVMLEDVVLRNTVTTNAIGFAFRANTNVQPPPPAIPSQANTPNVEGKLTNTNSPAYKRRLEREQRMRPRTNAPVTTQTLEEDPRK